MLIVDGHLERWPFAEAYRDAGLGGLGDRLPERHVELSEVDAPKTFRQRHVPSSTVILHRNGCSTPRPRPAMVCRAGCRFRSGTVGTRRNEPA